MLSEAQLALIQGTVPVLREHGVALTTYFYKRMLDRNPELKEVFNLGHQASGGQAKALANAVLAYAENIQQLEKLGDSVGLIVSKHVSLNIQPEQYDIVGSNLLHSISEVLDVPMDSELIQAWGIAYQQLANILIEAEKANYAAQLEQTGGWNGWREFEVVRKVDESSVISSFYLKPKDGGQIPKYESGQFVSIRVLMPELGHKQPRQYTLSSHYTANEYRISVKREAKTEFSVSNVLHETVKVGDTVELSNPNGNFVLKNKEKTNVFINAGVGLTPMVSMLGELAEQGSTQPVSFIHACQNDQVLAMRSLLEDLQPKLPQLKTYLACEQSEDSALHVDRVGRLDLSELDESLLPKDADYYLCGPLGFMKAQYESLNNLGIEKSQIHMELFSTGGLAELEA